MKALLSASAAFLFVVAGCWQAAQAQQQTAPPTSAQQRVSQPQQAGGPPGYPPPAKAAQQRPGQPKAAEAAPAQPTGQMQGQMPQGSYASTCKDSRMLGDSLVAFCRKNDGTWQTSELAEATRCTGDIQNNNGDLACPSGVSTGSSTPPAKQPPRPANAGANPAPNTAPSNPPTAGQGGAAPGPKGY